MSEQQNSNEVKTKKDVKEKDAYFFVIMMALIICVAGVLFSFLPKKDDTKTGFESFKAQLLPIECRNNDLAISLCRLELSAPVSDKVKSVNVGEDGSVTIYLSRPFSANETRALPDGELLHSGMYFSLKIEHDDPQASKKVQLINSAINNKKDELSIEIIASSNENADHSSLKYIAVIGGVRYELSPDNRFK